MNDFDSFNFQEKIEYLISLEHEGDFWDFKEAWHHNRADLLHDILCLANSSYRREKYLIIGVRDSKNESGFGVIGVATNDSNARETVQLNGFLRQRRFVGDLRPIVRVEHLEINEHEVDIVVIEPSKNVPFVLAEDYFDDKVESAKKPDKRIVRCGHIYVRIQDGNTPITSTAANDKVENLWRRRFRIDSSPYEKVLHFLQKPEDWEESELYVDSDDISVITYYYKYAPEYTIDFIQKCHSARDGDFLCKIWPDPTGEYHQMHMKVHNAVIKECLYAQLDGGRYYDIFPEYLAVTKDDVSYDYLYMSYLNKNTIEYFAHKFVLAKMCHGDVEHYARTWLQNVIMFNSEDEYSAFVDYFMPKRVELWKEMLNTKDVHQGMCPIWTDKDSHEYRSSKLLRQFYDEWSGNPTPN